MAGVCMCGEERYDCDGGKSCQSFNFYFYLHARIIGGVAHTAYGGRVWVFDVQTDWAAPCLAVNRTRRATLTSQGGIAAPHLGADLL
jgi:hypothetical protein